MKINDKNAICLAGEFAVLSQLALLGYDANMTLGHTKGVDILVSNPRTNRMCRLEVKTKLRKSDKQVSKSKIFGTAIGGWVMAQKHEAVTDPSIFYCFVIIREAKKKFRFFIIPSRVVARYVREEHRHWLKAKKKEGKKVKPNDMRTLRIGFRKNKYVIATPTAEKYEDKWDLGS
ncbi:MAG TPA: hypothetical protein VFW94_14875 [Candidatus Acidoferrales bacterium]|nr:hypothetical protein [Candidatus Acidoferrales bacterium]